MRPAAAILYLVLFCASYVIMYDLRLIVIFLIQKFINHKKKQNAKSRRKSNKPI